MAESWIKMRGSLVTNPKVIRMARLLLQDPEFLAWYAPQGLGSGDEQTVTRRHVTVVTRVTVGALVPFWSGVNECAANDGVLRDASHFECDEMAGVPGFGRALEAVGWLKNMPDGHGVELPNFTEHNTVGKERSSTAKTAAERAKDYRERRRHGVTETVTKKRDEKRDASRDGVTAEKRREEKIDIPHTPRGSRFGEFWNLWPQSERKVAKAACEKSWKARKLDEVADQILAHVAVMKASDQWQRGYEPSPKTYLNQSRWEDGAPESADLLTDAHPNRI